MVDGTSCCKKRRPKCDLRWCLEFNTCLWKWWYCGAFFQGWWRLWFWWSPSPNKWCQVTRSTNREGTGVSCQQLPMVSEAWNVSVLVLDSPKLRGALKPEEVGFEAARVTDGFKAYAVDFEVLRLTDACLEPKLQLVNACYHLWLM